MVNYTLPSLSPMNAGEEYYGMDNGTVLSNNSYTGNHSGLTLGQYMYIYICFLISILGLWWNGTVIWLLGFCIKRTPFTTYILNLSMADFGLLTVNLILYILSLLEVSVLKHLLVYILILMFLFYSTGQFLLTAISIDRCVAVLFPLWHRCHRPPNMSTAVCASIWGLSSIFPAIDFTLLLADFNVYNILGIHLIVNGFLCLPLMTIATLILFIRVCFKSHQRRRGKLLIIVLLALFFFVIFSFPLNTIFIFVYVLDSEPPSFLEYAFILAYLDSCINPLIYFLVGRQKRGRCRQSMKATFQNVFKEDENPAEAGEISLETQL
ncbi:mas-related G-protein coupled receptor member H-like [Podarcis raffonei]|uniref:mas-related G-protein coupled receptor member H-like n=1 Tax=Podarcis raffonei TaxID=65483 RepID=UPI0023293C41|nr:mas-related G-protein coupled receptor member H-like [Podarcis raffonei]